ncbi:Adaptive-response sensory-kinase SasA [anaerobic digester metagenome]|jgi:PAS domain S-box-containing protein
MIVKHSGNRPQAGIPEFATDMGGCRALHVSETMSGPLRVLLIGGRFGDVRRIGEMLAGCGREVALAHCERIEDGPAAVSGDEVEVVLLDLADGRGAGIVGRLREAAPETPIIVLTAANDDPVVSDAMERGAQDYLVKGKTDAELLCRAVRYALEHRRAARALRHSEETYRRLVENLNEGVVAVDEAGIITFANPAMEEILGRSAGGLAGLSIAGFIDTGSHGGEGGSPFCRRTDQRQEFETDFLAAGGGRVHALVVTSPLVDADGAFSGCLAGVLDITDRKNAEEALRQSEQKYRLVVESLSEGIWVLDPDACTSFVNPRMAEMLGYAPEEMIGRSIHSFIPAAHTATMEDRLRFRRDGAREEYECEFITREGGRITGLMIACPFSDDAGEFQGSIAGVMDITERKRAEEDIRTRNQQLTVLNQIISVSAASLSLAELLEESLEKTLELMGLHVGIVYMLDAERKRALLQHQSGMPQSCMPKNRIIKVHHWPFNFIFIAGQPRYIERHSDLNSIEASILEELEVSALACVPLIAESVVVGAVYAGSAEKDSFSREEKTLLETIGKEIGSGILKGMLHKKLEAANREANLYLDIMTHDIKNAENVSSLYADLLIEMLGGDAALYAKKIRNSVRKSAEIIGNVTTIRRIHHDTPELGPVDLDAVIREEVAASPDIAIEVGVSRRQVWGDELLSEVFANIIRNAVKFGGPRVRITVKVEEYDDENVLVSIEDTGPGVPDGMKESIFHRFERGWVEGCGDGLGLFIVRTLIERYGGTIRVEDRVEGRPDLGAAFRFTLREYLPSGDDEDDEYPDGEVCE